MNVVFKRRLRRIIFIAVGIFIALFIARLGYGYYYPGNTDFNFFDSSSEDISTNRKNYATEKFKKADAAPVDGKVFVPEQPSATAGLKYEKVATVKAKTSQFDADEKSIRDKVSSYNAIIQYEQKRGNKGDRTTSLTIGIAPEKFDSFHAEVLKIGKILSMQVSKTDMTNEFLQLNAKKASLEKVRTSLLELKSRPGKIDEYMQLENRILEIEEQLQGLGVELGNFDEENEYCTVRFSLIEGRAEQTISIVQRLKVAFEWTAKYALIMYGIITFILIGAYVLLLIIDKGYILYNKLGIFKENK